MYGLRKKVLLLMGDISLIAFSTYLSVSVGTAGPFNALDSYAGVTGLSTVVYLLGFYVFDLYNFSYRFRSPSYMMRLMSASIAGTVVTAAAFYLIPPLGPGKSILLLNMMFVSTLAYLWRLSMSAVLHSAVRPRNFAIVGAGDSGRTIYEALTGNGKNG
jgi:FlaA1/EpsC-like NDP-sugar epimerase